MNFGKSFVKHEKALYNNISSCIMNNGVTSNLFLLLWAGDVRQVDPLSLYSFILALESVHLR